MKSIFALKSVFLLFSFTESPAGMSEGARRAPPGSGSSGPERGERARQERERQKLLGAEPQGNGAKDQRSEGGSEGI